MQQLFIQFIVLIMYGSSYKFRHYVAFLNECLVAWCKHHATRHNTPIHNILSTAPQLSIPQKTLGNLPGDGNLMPKRVGATIYN
jgi:hypothetical protein